MSDCVIGTCSLCGGAVTVPETWMGIHPPTPTCSKCHGVPKQPHGPVIDMKPATPLKDKLRPSLTEQERQAKLADKYFHHREAVENPGLEGGSMLDVLRH